MAAQLTADGLAVTTKPGGWGELRVNVDGRDVYKRRFAKPAPEEIVEAVRAALDRP